MPSLHYLNFILRICFFSHPDHAVLDIIRKCQYQSIRPSIPSDHFHIICFNWILKIVSNQKHKVKCIIKLSHHHRCCFHDVYFNVHVLSILLHIQYICDSFDGHIKKKISSVSHFEHASGASIRNAYVQTNKANNS